MDLIKDFSTFTSGIVPNEIEMCVIESDLCNTKVVAEEKEITTNRTPATTNNSTIEKPVVIIIADDDTSSTESVHYTSHSGENVPGEMCEATMHDDREIINKKSETPLTPAKRKK